MTNKEFVEKNLGKKVILCMDANPTLEGIIVGYDDSDEGILIGGTWWGSVGPSNRYSKASRFVLYEEDYGLHDVWCWNQDSLKLLEEEQPITNRANRETVIDDYLSRFKDIERIIINDNATIVLLKDGRKGVVKVGKNEIVDDRVGILEAYVKALKVKASFNYTITGFPIHLGM